MPVHTVGVHGWWGPSISIVKNVESILRFTESWRDSGMKNPDSCNLRRTRPVGPMVLCSDLDCYRKCVELTKNEK